MDPAVEGWREILAPQALDLALLAAFIALALVSFFRKSVALKYVTFVAAVGYLGFTKSSLISVSDIFRADRPEPAGVQVQPRLVPASWRSSW